MLNMQQRRWVVTLATLVVALLTARLGFWQLERAAQKTALQAAIDARAHLPAIDGAAQLASRSDLATAQHYRTLHLVGHWSSAHTVYLDNRQMQGRPGFLVLTPLILRDGSAVLVQRGWLARDFQDRSRVADVPTPGGMVDLMGRVAPPPGRLFEFRSGEAGRIRQNIDLDAFARETGLALRPLTMQLIDAPVAVDDGLLRDWPAPLSGVAKHYGYAAQWFALSALIVLLYVWYQYIQPRRQRDAT